MKYVSGSGTGLIAMKCGDPAANKELSPNVEPFPAASNFVMCGLSFKPFVTNKEPVLSKAKPFGEVRFPPEAKTVSLPVVSYLVIRLELLAAAYKLPSASNVKPTGYPPGL